MALRNEKGQFITEHGNSRYKNCKYNNKQMGVHRREFCRALGVDGFPSNFIIHHIDGNKKNNSIDNLALITTTAHNRIHTHIPWNKGLTTDNKKWKETQSKALKTRKDNYLILCKETHEMQTAGKKLREIAVDIGVSRSQVSSRIKDWKTYVKQRRQK